MADLFKEILPSILSTKKSVLPGYEEPNEETCKCEDCKHTLPLSMFRPYGTGGRAYRAKCRDCEKKYNKNLAALRKQAPPKPDRCDVTGRITENLVMDHDHETNDIRGWIEDGINIALARLGDNIEGVRLLLAYMERYEARKNRG